MTQSRAPWRLEYIPALDGLRGLAVLAVLLYHADVRQVPGGFLGVEAFFVLSGYLITSLLLGEWEYRGRIGLFKFWQRRAWRLGPAMGAMVLTTVVVVAIWLPGRLCLLCPDALAAIGYVSNWQFIITQRPYFEAMGRPPLLRHTWSLAVEAQFYLIWPLVVIAALRNGSRRRVLTMALAGALASASLMAVLFDPDADPSRVYYGTDTRLSGILLGAALACLWPPHHVKDERPTRWSGLVGMAGLGGLALACVYVDEFQLWLYRGGMVAISLLSVATIWAAVQSRAGRFPRLLGGALLRWLGTRSYGIYLWHWPVFMLTRPQLDLPLAGLPLLALRLAATLALAECSYRLIERPIRHGATLPLRRLRVGVSWGAPVVMALAILVLLSKVVVTAMSAPSSEPTSQAYVVPVATEAPTATPSPLPTATPISTPTHTPTATPTFAVPATATPSPIAAAGAALTPTASPTPAPTSTPTATPTPTSTLAPTPVPRVLAVGDSVMVGARRALLEALPNVEVDASVGRQAPETVSILRARRQEGRLGDVVVVHLGSNGIFRARQLDRIMAELSDVPKVIFVNVRVPRHWQDPINKMLDKRIPIYPNTLLADWYAASDGHPEYFRDGVHLTEEGARAYAGLIAAWVDTPLHGRSWRSNLQ